LGRGLGGGVGVVGVWRKELKRPGVGEGACPMARRTTKPSQKNTLAGKARRASTSRTPARHAGGKKPIDLYYWPTPNGWKITIMLEECVLPYTVIPVDISKG